MRPALLALLLIVTAAWAELGPLYTEEDGKFEFRPPTGWKIGEFPGLKYKIHHAATTGDGFAPKINFSDEAFDGSFESYMTKAMRGVESVLKGKITTEPAIFKLDSGLLCYRSVFEAKQQDRDLRFISFQIRLEYKKAVIATFSSLKTDGDKWDEVVAESIRTFAATK